MRKLQLGAEAILTIVLLPFLLWVVTSIFSLQSSSALDNFKVEQIKEMLEKQDKKLDSITELLINK